jgi:hypothetical protein
MARLLYFFIVIFLFVGCGKTNEVTKSFYFWKTSFALSTLEENLLNDLAVKKLYVHYFDVNFIKEKGASFPVGKLTFEKEPPQGTEIVPVVYVVNDVFNKTHPSKVAELAINVFSLIKSINTRNQILPNEIQFDCDWTDATQEKYFRFLEELKKLTPKAIRISATIRLHQIKYKRRTGIPPVDRGMLMFYNMGQLKAHGPQNSIYDFDIAKSYTSYIKTYPLPLDYALPIFSWGIWSRNGKILGLLNSITEQEIINNNNFKKISDHLYIVNEGGFFKGKYLFQGDKIFVEEVTSELAEKAIQQLIPEINSSNFTVAIYHLNPTLFVNYDQQKIENLYSRFN